MNASLRALMPKEITRSRWGILLLPAAFVLLSVFLIPLLAFFRYSFQSFADMKVLPGWTLATYMKFITDPFYWQTVINSVYLGVLCTALTLLIAYPAALFMAYKRGTFLFFAIGMAVFLPLLMSVVVRAYGWQLMLAESGVIDWVLVNSGIVQEPVRLMFNWIGVIISVVHVEMPFMLFPLLTVLMQLPPELNEAACDLGAVGFQTWRRVTFPLSLSGILAGCQIVFTTSISAFASPTILGGGRVRVMPVLIYQSVLGLDWPLGAVMSIVLLALSLVLVAGFSRLLRTRGLYTGAAA
jgi:putative spermidine/putrescine transport system permease protein